MTTIESGKKLIKAQRESYEKISLLIILFILKKQPCTFNQAILLGEIRCWIVNSKDIWQIALYVLGNEGQQLALLRKLSTLQH